MKYLKLLLLILPFFVISCGNEEEPEPNLFSFAVQLDSEGEVALGVHHCEITIPGEQQYIKVTLIGDFDSFDISNDMPSWLTVTPGEKTISILVSSLGDGAARSGKIGFTVFKGNTRNTGSITVLQTPS